jgi:hypothetical protein
VRNIELAWISAWPAPGEQQLAVRRVFVHPGVAIAVGHIDVALWGHRGVSAAMERLAAHVWSRLAGDAEGQQHLSFQRALADGVVSIVGEPNRVVRRHEHAMRPGKDTLSE